MSILLGGGHPTDQENDKDRMHEYYFSQIWRYPRRPLSDDPDCE